MTFQRERVGGAFKLREWSFSPTPIGDSEEEVNKLFTGMFKIPDIWKAPDDAFYKESKEIAEILGMQLEQNLKALTGGMGAMDQAHPKAFQPGPAQQLGNPAFQQPAAQQPAWTPPPQDNIPNFPSPAARQPAPAPQQAPLAAAPMAQPAPSPAAVAPTPAPVAQPAWTPPAAAPQAPIQQSFAPPMAQPAPTGLPTGTTAAKAPSAAPPGAPTCFSDPAVFNRASNKCMVCNYDYHCEKAIAARTASA